MLNRKVYLAVLAEVSTQLADPQPYEIEEAILDYYGGYVRLETEGREIGTMLLSFEDMGIPLSAARTEKVRPPRLVMLPEQEMRKIAAIFSRARSFLEESGVQLPGRRFLYVSNDKWDALRQKMDGFQAEVTVIVNQLLDQYDGMVEMLLADVTAKANEAYAALTAAGEDMPIAEYFVEEMVRKVRSKIPTESQIKSIGLRLVLNRPAPMYIVAAVERAINRYYDRSEQEQRELEQIKAMSEDKAAMWAAQAVTVNMLDELTIAAGQRIHEFASLASGKSGKISPAETRAFKSELQKFLSGAGKMVSTRQVNDTIYELLDLLGLPSGKRKGFGAACKRLVRQLDELSESSNQPRYGSIGSGVVSLDFAKCA